MNKNNDKIRKLSYREQARDKIQIWYGSADNYIHALKEIIANATDEIINNFDEGTIYVELHDDNKTITVRDTGRGIRIDGETDGTPNYELLYLIPFAGTKYQNENGLVEGNYTGSNGSGQTIANYTSTYFEVSSYYNGKKHHIKFENGGDITEPLTIKKSDEEHGTKVTFRLDSDVYTETEYTSKQVLDIIEKYAVSSPKITIEYRYKEEKKTIHYDSIIDRFDSVVGETLTSSSYYGENIIYEEESGERTQIELVFATATEPEQEAYLNLTHLPEGGTINEGILNGIKLYANKYCRDNNLFPKNLKSFSDVDIEQSISFVAVVLSNNVEFQNQTKFSTAKKLYFEIAKRRTQQALEVMEIEDNKGFKALIDHLLLVQKDNTSNQKQKEKLKKKLKEKVDNMTNRIEKFVDCEVHGEEAELYLAEGDSAHGSVVLARDGRFQASMPMGGKFLNVEKVNDIDAITNNKIVMNVVKVLGCGIDLGKKYKDVAEFDISKMRYGKVICASDEDPDGAQIQCLIITMFNKLMPEVISSGRLYIAKTPLYEIKLKNDDVVYVYTDEERDKAIKEHGANVIKISRSKGLGELNAEVMAETAMNPETRQLIQVQMKDVEKAKQAIDDWMGTDTANRKEFISENLNQYIAEAINE